MTKPKPNRQRAYDIINGMGGICATENEVKKAYKILKDSANKNLW